MHSLDSNYVNLQEELNETKKALPSSGDCPICSKPFKKLKTHFNTCFIKKHAPQIDKQSNSVKTSNDLANTMRKNSNSKTSASSSTGLAAGAAVGGFALIALILLVILVLPNEGGSHFKMSVYISLPG